MREKRKQQDNQRAQFVLLALYELQHTIRTSLHQSLLCPESTAGRTPSFIVGFLCDDVVARHSFVFSILFRSFGEMHGILKFIWQKCNLLTQSQSYATILPGHTRDNRCDDCKRWNDNYQQETYFSRIHSLTFTTESHMPASKLRARPNDTLCRPCRPGTLPEIAFFSPLAYKSRFMYYKAGDDDEIKPPASLSPLPLHSWRLRQLNWGYSTESGHYGSGRCGVQLDIKPHYSCNAGGTKITSQCLAVTHKKGIMKCEIAALTNPAVKIIPADYWLPTMDPKTYPRPQANQIRSQCRNLPCTNYYQKKKQFTDCRPWPLSPE
ncbi:hypothetical protein GMOD_00004352 [Pyrenophora seminiperda CCB06]|uniref:Uncharacterized protein n=1 Tax=Pyrenophora seminiperda CCB06 TaxID=1302712 RepID=A0A3M7M0Z4_9PLEO|nr:hypothetical protein GMOD_00004352 [Pyrenophora seminiperda CCB06]